MLLGDRTLDVPARLRPGARGGPAPHRASPPPTCPLDAQSRLVLCRRLVREGLLEIAVSSPQSTLPLRGREPAARRAVGGHRHPRPHLPAARARRAVGRGRAARRPAARRARRGAQQRARTLRAKVLLIRRFSSQPDGAGAAGLRGVRPPGRPWLETGRPRRPPRGARPRPRGARRGRSHRAGAVRRLAVLRLHPRPPRRLLRRARPAGRRGARPTRTPRRPGRSRTSAATGSPPTCWCSRTASTTGGSTR